jgi:hypothetical protein
MSDTKNDFDGELNAGWWRDYLEEKERIRQLADKAFVEKFWELRVKSTFRWLRHIRSRNYYPV